MKDNEALPYAQEGYDLMAAAFEVHNTQGGGLGEDIYQQSLELELAMREIPFHPKKQLEVYYKGYLLATRYIPDLVAYDSIIVELKSVRRLGNEHTAQLLNYMRVLQQPVGYAINFGSLVARTSDHMRRNIYIYTCIYSVYMFIYIYIYRYNSLLNIQYFELCHLFIEYQIPYAKYLT